MKLLVALVLSVCALQALALPTFEDPNAPEHMPGFEDPSAPEHMPGFEDPSAPEHMPGFEDPNGLEHMPKIPRRITPANEVVDNFRREIDAWFTRFSNFYDRTNVAMRRYRLDHVDLVTRVYNSLMTVFGDEIEEVRQSAYSLVDLIAERRTTLGQDNACLNGVMADFEVNSRLVSNTIMECATYANVTYTRLLLNVFYPTFATIQTQISTVPVAVIDSLSRGNVLQDEEEILEFLRARYEAIDLQWYTAVSQLLRWESNRFEVDGMFMVDEQTICISTRILEYFTTNAALEVRTRAC